MTNSTGFTDTTDTKSSGKTVGDEILVYVSTITLTAVLVAILGFIFQLIYNFNKNKHADREKANDIDREKREKKKDTERNQRNFDNTRATNLMKDISNSMDKLYYQIRYVVIKYRRDVNGVRTTYYIDSKENDKLKEYYRTKKEWWENWLYRLSASEVQFGRQVKEQLVQVHNSFVWVCSKIHQQKTEQSSWNIIMSQHLPLTESTAWYEEGDEWVDIISKIRQIICYCNYVMITQIQNNQVGFSNPGAEYAVEEQQIESDITYEN